MFKGVNCLLKLSSRQFSTKVKLKMNKIAVCQMTSTNDKGKNMEVFKRLMKRASENQVKMAFFPEATDYVGESLDETLSMAEPLGGPTMREYCRVASEHNIWISVGGFHEKFTTETNEIKLHNSHVIIDDNGNIQDIYRKLHLFNVSIPEKNLHLQESRYVINGRELLKPTRTPVGLVGLSICYDLRFPEISTLLRKMGAQILTYPSAFTFTTGSAHWEVLMRARAIENQCYVVSAAQYGKHNDKRSSFGYSIVVDPWGEVVASCPRYDEGKDSDESVAFATVDLSLLEKVRSEMPVMNHRRNDVYDLQLIEDERFDIDETEYTFSHIEIPSSTVFYRSKYSYAFTNVKCVVPGHVLVSSLRVVPRIENLTRHELEDFFKTVAKVQKVMETRYGTNSSTVCIQDGMDAGQTVCHVHCHILPRTANDFENNDEIYSRLAKHDRDDSKRRDVDDMAKEATALRKFFH